MLRLYSCVKIYSDLHANVSFAFRQASRDDAVEAFERSGFDVMLELRFGDPAAYVEEAGKRGFVALPLLTEPTAMWFQADNAAMRDLDETITFEQLKEIPLLTSSGELFDYFGFATARLFEEKGAVPLFRRSTLSASPSTYFLTDFRDSVLLTTRGMTKDPRLNKRDDLRCIITTDPVFEVTTFLVARQDNEAAMDFVDFVADAVRHTSFLCAQ